MPRIPRPHVPKQVLHLIARGNRRQAIFEDAQDYARLEQALLAESLTGAFELLAYCLMPNHIHAVARCSDEPIGRVLHRILTAHAVYMNKKYGRTGHLFQDRFKSIPCETDEGLLLLIRYVHLNPVRAGLAADAGDWQWSSHRDYAGGASRPGIHSEVALAMFAAERGAAAARYAAFMAEAGTVEGFDRASSGLAGLAAAVERAGGHCKGFMLSTPRTRPVLDLRVRFIQAALERGHSNRELADFLGCAPSTVTWASKQARGEKDERQEPSVNRISRL